MCNWEQAWLAYELIENQKDKKYFESVYTQIQNTSYLFDFLSVHMQAMPAPSCT